LFHHGAELEPYCRIFVGHSVTTMGAFSYSWTSLDYGISVGRYCSIARGLQSPGPRHPLENVSTSSYLYDRDLSLVEAAILDDRADGYNNFISVRQLHMPVIGNDVWIGNQVTIMPVVEIRDGAVIGAGAVVAKDVPPYAVVVGNPGAVKRLRFSERTVKRMLAVRWWRYKFTNFRSLDLNDPERFLDQVEEAQLPEFVPEKMTADSLAAELMRRAV
jgi:acetyltransferase-like isoleucine patch superfamily enzyme